MEISHHVTSGAVLDAHFAIGYSVCNKVVSYADVSGAFTARSLPIFFEFHRVIVVLVTDVVLNLFLLGLQEVPASNHLGKDVVHSHQFSFLRTLGV